MILGPLWGGALTRRLYLMLGVMTVLEVILAVSKKQQSFGWRFYSRILSLAAILGVVTQRYSPLS